MTKEHELKSDERMRERYGTLGIRIQTKIQTVTHCRALAHGITDMVPQIHGRDLSKLVGSPEEGDPWPDRVCEKSIGACPTAVR